MSIEMVNKLADACVDKRISKIQYKHGGIEISMEVDLPLSPDDEKAAKEIADLMKQANSVTDDEILENPMAGLI